MGMQIRRGFGLLLCCALWACEPGEPVAGGETHFLDACEQTCAAGLTCVCGVCTMECDSDSVCSEMGPGASCVGMNAYACDSDMPRFCEQSCERDADCGGMGAGFRCAAGVCRMAGDPRALSPEEKPFVLFLVDTSGSMERRADCTCTTPGCLECLPVCGTGSERNRWTGVLEALTGSWSEADFACDRLERSDANGATYDRHYSLPYHRPPLGMPQADDGVLDVFRTRIRFASATFDGEPTYGGASDLVTMQAYDEGESRVETGMWSFGGTRPLFYPGCDFDYAMDTGIRGPQALDGPLTVGMPSEPMLQINERVQAQLLPVRPFGGTPTAAALDDLRMFFETAPTAFSRTLDPGRDRVILITDGIPDDDYRTLGCGCVQVDDPGAEGYCGPPPKNLPHHMKCPYPLPEDAAAALREHLPVEVVALALDSSAPDMERQTRERLAAIAAAGSDQPLLEAADGVELREVLMQRLEALLR